MPTSELATSAADATATTTPAPLSTADSASRDVAAANSVPTPTTTPGIPTEVRLLEMVFPDQTNHYGTLFGGHALALMDKAAFIAASRYSRRTVVTARSEQIDFRSPVRQGQLIELIGRVVATGRSSMTVAVELYAEDLLSGARTLCTRGHFVMIALDATHQPVAVPALMTVDPMLG